MKSILLFAFLVAGLTVNAQLKAKTLKGKLGDSTLTYHENGKISTIDYRSEELFRINTFIAFDNKGKEIFKGDHGYRHGGAGLEPSFYRNGQVSSVRSTFQPDGGIQYYDETTFFNEDGSFNRKEDHSMNTERHTIIYDPLSPKQIQKEEAKVVANMQDSTQLVIKNNTKRKVIIAVANKSNEQIFTFKLNRKATLNIGSFLAKKGNFNPKEYFVVNMLANDTKAENYAIVWISDVSTAKKSVLMLLDISELR